MEHIEVQGTVYLVEYDEGTKHAIIRGIDKQEGTGNDRGNE